MCYPSATLEVAAEEQQEPTSQEQLVEQMEALLEVQQEKPKAMLQLERQVTEHKRESPARQEKPKEQVQGRSRCRWEEDESPNSMAQRQCPTNRSLKHGWRGEAQQCLREYTHAARAKRCPPWTG